MIKWIGFTFIALCVLLAYAPSLMQLPRGDQVHYLAEVAGKHSLWDLTIGCIDLNRHRLISAGDQVLFRPLLYIILGAERYFFQYHFMYWQATGIILHLIVVWLLLGLFCAMGEVIPAILATAFFALLFVNMEMVVWQHISSYIFFIILLLLSLLRLHKICSSQENRRRDYWVLWLLLLAACLTYEIGNGFALLVGMVIWARGLKHRGWAMALFAIPLIYLGLSLINVLVHPFVFPKADPITAHGGLLRQLSNMFYAIGAWAYIGVFPHEFEWVIRSRNMIATTEMHLIKWPHLDQWPSVIGMGIILLFA